MWVPRKAYEELAREAGAAVALSREVTHLRSLIASLTAREHALKRLELEPVPAPVSLDLDDGLPPVVRDAIAEFAQGDLQVTRSLAKVARGRVRKLGPNATDEQLEALAEEIASGVDPEFV